MPIVPSVGLSPTSRPQFQAPGVVAFRAGPEQRQFQALGVRQERMGQIMSQIGMEIEDKVNDARAMEASNVFEHSVNMALLEYRQKKGKDAVEAREALFQTIQEQRDGAGKMLLNETQRTQFSRIADKINNRAGLSIEAHYAAEAAADKQSQNLARQVVLQDGIIANDIGPQSVVDFGQLNVLIAEEGEARGLSGDALEVFALGKRDKLFQNIVTAKLDTQDPGQIAQVKELMEALPDGIISKTQKQSLDQLVSGKTMESDAFAWASQLAERGMTYQDGLQEIYSLAKSNPKLAKQYQRELDTRFLASRRAESEQRSGVLQALSDKVVAGESLSAAEIQQARQVGVLFDLEKLQDDVENVRDRTTTSGKAVYAALLNNIPELMEIGNGAEVYAFARSKGMSHQDATMLAGQRNRYEVGEGLGRRASGKSNSSRVEFDIFDTDEDHAVDIVLFQLDAKNAAEKNQEPYRQRVARAYAGNTTESNYALRMMAGAYKMEVMNVANDLLRQLPDGEVVNRNQILQRAGEIVYERGFLDEEKKINRYTTEYRFLPDVPDDVLAKYPQARADLREQQRQQAMREVFARDPRMIEAGVRPDQMVRLAMESLFDPQMVRSLAQANLQASAAEAQSTISEYDVQARAQVLLQQEIDQERAESAEENEKAERSIAYSLLNLKTEDLKSTYMATDVFGRKVERGYTREEDRARARIRHFFNLPAVQALREQWPHDPDEYEAFALQFYSGPARDQKYLPISTKRLLERMQSIPRATDRPGEQRSRFDALRIFYKLGGSN